MIRKSLILIFIILFLASCDLGIKKKSSFELYDLKLKKIIFETPKLKNELFKIFDINNVTNPKLFKILISRKNHFVRITIYQIFFENEINEMPSGLIKYNKNIFLYYNSSELIFDKYITKDYLEKNLLESNIKLMMSYSQIIDSRILQFDISNTKNIKITYPPISPYDEDQKNINFK